MSDKEQTREFVLEWWMTPIAERTTKKRLMKKAGIVDIRTLNNYIEEIRTVPIEEYDPDAYLANSAKTVDAALIRACERGSPGALKAYYQITNRLVEKSENINLDISGDELTRRNLEAARRLRELGYGVEDVPTESPLLLKDVRSSSGQVTQGDSQI